MKVLPLHQSGFIICTLFLFIFPFSCSAQNSSEPQSRSFENQRATVTIKVCSRGCYQYLLKINTSVTDEYLYPETLPDEYKTDKLEITFSGQLTGESYDVLKPGANDAPLVDFTIPKVSIEKISRN